MTFSDSDSYSSHFLTSVELSGDWLTVAEDRFEVGYLIFEKFIYTHLPIHYTSLFLVHGLIVFSVSLYFYYKNAEKLWLALFLFVGLRHFFFYVSAMRQSLALAIILLAFIVQLHEECKYRLIKTLCLCVIAYFLHSSSIIALCILPLRNIRYTVNNLVLFIGITIFITTFLDFFIDIVGKGESIYLEDEGFQTGNFISVAIYGGIVLFSLNKIEIEERRDRFIFWGSVLCFLFSFLSLFLTVANRVVPIFSPLAILLIEKTIREQQRYNQKLLLILLSAIVILMFIIVLLYKPEWNGVYPYYFFWETDAIPFKIYR